MTEDARPLTDEEIEQAAVTALENSLGGPDTEIGKLRLRNLEAYNAQAEGRFAPPEVDDRSDFVATDVADTVNGMLPQLMQMFVSSPDAVEFEARQAGAEQQAKLATAYLNHLFYVRNDGVSIIHDWFWDALVMKVGFVKVWAEDEQEDARQAYKGQTPEQLLMLLQEGWSLDGKPQQDEDGTLDFVVKKQAQTQAIKCAAVAPAEMRVDVNARWDDDPAMIGHVFWKRRFEWTQDGYDVSEIGNGSARSDMESMELLNGADMIGEPAHASHHLIEGAEIYIRLDADGDGIAEWLKVCLIEGKLARTLDGEAAYEKVDDHPFVWICPNPRPHSFYGDCPADFAYQPQRLRTQIVRAIEDNLYTSVNPRTYINTAASVNIDDVLDSRPNGVVRGKGPMAEALGVLAQPNLGAPAYQFNEFIGSWNETRTGYNRYSAGTDANALNKTKGGMELLTAKADMRMGLTARHFAVGVRRLFAKLLKLAVTYQNIPEMVVLNGTFVPINPSEFRDQLRVKINVGLGTGTKEQQSARIMAFLQMLIQAGAPAGVVRPEHIAELLSMYAEANEFKNPERFVDAQPSGMPPNPAAYQAEKQQVQQGMAKAQQEMQRLAQENAQLKLQMQGKQADTAIKAGELELKRDELELKQHQALADLTLRDHDMSRAERQDDRTHARADRAEQKQERDGSLEQRVDDLTALVQALLGALQPNASQ